MSAPIGKGDWVECVSLDDAGDDDPFEPVMDGNWYEIGGVYVVDEIGVYEGDPWLNCAGMVRPLFSDGWALDAFRLIYRPDESLITRLLETLPAEPEAVPVFLTLAGE